LVAPLPLLSDTPPDICIPFIGIRCPGTNPRQALDSGARDEGALLGHAWGDAPVQLRPAAALTLRAHLAGARTRELCVALNHATGR